MNTKTSPLILLSGMGADERVFAKQMAAIPSLTVAKWIAPIERESLATYAARFAGKINPGKPCFIGGASFGGFVALEMIRHLDVIACFLVGSARSPDEFPEHFKFMKVSSGFATMLPFEVLGLLSKAFLLSSGALLGPHLTELMSQMSEQDADFLRWASRAVLEWEGPGNTGDVPIYHIHGGNDFVLPVRNVHADVVVDGAGHALSMSHPDQVIEFLRMNMARFEG